MPVGTLGAVKGVTPQELEAAGASIMLSNLYHLALRPGIDIVERLGGIHGFTGWRGPILTDSGGFQVWSLGGLRTVDAGGVTFRSHLDGSPLRFTPEGVVSFQQRMGVDIAMVLDECPPWPVEPAAAAASWERTLAWAGAARAAWQGRADGGGLFGIVQGSVLSGPAPAGGGGPRGARLRRLRDRRRLGGRAGGRPPGGGGVDGPRRCRRTSPAT